MDMFDEIWKSFDQSRQIWKIFEQVCTTLDKLCQVKTLLHILTNHIEKTFMLQKQQRQN